MAGGTFTYEKRRKCKFYTLPTFNYTHQRLAQGHLFFMQFSAGSCLVGDLILPVRLRLFDAVLRNCCPHSPSIEGVKGQVRTFTFDLALLRMQISPLTCA